MDPNEIAEAMMENFRQMHAYIDGLPDSPQKAHMQRLAAIFHGHGNALGHYAAGAGVIAFGGTDKPPPGP